IVGILSPGEGIVVYPIHAKALKQFDDEPERWIDLTWDVGERRRGRFPARLHVTALNEVGTLAQIAQVIGDHDGNISNVQITKRASDFYEMQIEVEVWDLKHLNRILAELRRKAVVSAAVRITD